MRQRTLSVGVLAAGLAAAVTLAGTTPAIAQTATFGADLAARPANDNPQGTCAQAPPDRFAPTGSPSCMWSYIGNYPSTLVAPASGTVTQIRVKVGATTGPMRVNVIRFLFQQTGDPSHPSTAGPFLEAYGPQFTPGAGAITPVATNLHLREDPTPPPSDTSTIQVIDALALEVLSNTVPIPVYIDNSYPLVYPTYPGPTASGVPAPSPNALPTYTTLGYGVLMNADFTADAGTTPTPTAPTTPGPTTPGTTTPGTTAAPAVALGANTARVRSNVARVPIRCVGADCVGRVALLRRAGAAAVTSYGSARFSAKAGKTATVKVTLNRAGRKLLRKRRRVTVTARVTFTAGGGAAKSFKLVLRR